MIKKLCVLIVIFSILGFGLIKFYKKSYRVIRIIDGDTIQVRGIERNIRLIGIDTAEKGECYYEKSIQVISELLLNKNIIIQKDINEIDGYGRILGYLYLEDGTFVNERLLELGAGTFFYDSVNLTQQKKLIEAAENAKTKNVGLWEYCGPCLVKGNYDIHGKRYYHLPEYRHYDQVVVNLNKGDRWFCSQKEAEAAGFVKSRE